MGRTVASFHQEIQRIEAEEWSSFRRALRKEDQELLDKLFSYARFHAAPGAYAANPLPMESVFMAMLIELLKCVEALRKRIEALECREDKGMAL